MNAADHKKNPTLKGKEYLGNSNLEGDLRIEEIQIKQVVLIRRQHIHI